MIGEDGKSLCCVLTWPPICYNSSRLVCNVLLSLIYVMMMYGNLLYDVSPVDMATSGALVYDESLLGFSLSRILFANTTEKVSVGKTDEVISFNADELSKMP